MVDARTQLAVLLDALRARTAVLSRRDDLPSAARADVDDAVLTHVMIDSTLARAATADEVNSLRYQVFACLAKLEHAGQFVKLDLPADQPFHGLCSIDPQHGAATASPDGPGLCRSCVDATMNGVPRAVRLVAKHGRPVPFDQIERSERRGSPADPVGG